MEVPVENGMQSCLVFPPPVPRCPACPTRSGPPGRLVDTQFIRFEISDANLGLGPELA